MKKSANKKAYKITFKKSLIVYVTILIWVLNYYVATCQSNDKNEYYSFTEPYFLGEDFSKYLKYW